METANNFYNSFYTGRNGDFGDTLCISDIFKLFEEVKTDFSYRYFAVESSGVVNLILALSVF